MPIGRRILIGLAAMLGLLILLSVAPAPGAEGLFTLRVDMQATRTILGQYELDVASSEAKPTTILSWDAVIHNSWQDKLSFLSTRDHTASISLHAGSTMLARHEKFVGDFPILGTQTREFTTVFLETPPGDYTITVVLRDADGASRATHTQAIQVYARNQV